MRTVRPSRLGRWCLSEDDDDESGRTLFRAVTLEEPVGRRGLSRAGDGIANHHCKSNGMPNADVMDNEVMEGHPGSGMLARQRTWKLTRRLPFRLHPHSSSSLNPSRRSPV